MRGLIFRVSESDGVGERDIAGRMLLERQLQWLRSQGIHEVAVEVGPSDADVRCSGFLLGSDPLVDGVVVIPSDTPLGPEELRARAGFDLETGVLELPADVLCAASIEPLVERGHASQVTLKAPSGCATDAVTFALRFVFGHERPAQDALEGWGARVESEQAALQLTCQVLDGSLRGPLMHAHERQPGVWVERAAHVSPEARLVAPLLIGSRAFVAAGATVGPRAVLEPRAVVQRGASVVDARVLAGTLVGEGVEVRRTTAGPRGLLSLRDDALIPSEDPLALAVRDPWPRSHALGRLLALALVAVLAVPFALGATLFLVLVRGRPPVVRRQWPDGQWRLDGQVGLRALDVWPRLWDVVRGRRYLLGSLEPHAAACAGAVDVGPRLSREPGEVRRRMWPWYAARKSGRLDRRLLSGN